jgi:hypothetical protein
VTENVDVDSSRAQRLWFCELLSAREVSTGVYSIPAAQPPALVLAWCQGDPKFLQVELPPYFALRQSKPMGLSRPIKLHLAGRRVPIV